MEEGIRTERRPIRLGLVGLGKIARDQHVPAIVANPAFALAATADPSGQANALPGVPMFAGLDAMLGAGPMLDAIVLCTPPAVRSELAHTAVAAGLSVMLEKPPGATMASLAGLENAARRQGVSLFTAWHSSVAPGVEPARAWLRERAVERVELVWRENINTWHPGQDWLLAAGGFGVFDPAINAFSILTTILAQPLAFGDARLLIPANRAAPVAAEVTLRAGEAAIHCDLSILEAGPQRWDITVHTDAGLLRLSEGGHRLMIVGSPVSLQPAAEYPRLYGQFAELIGARQCAVDLAPLALIEAALAQGQAVLAPDFHFA